MLNFRKHVCIFEYSSTYESTVYGRAIHFLSVFARWPVVPLE